MKTYPVHIKWGSGEGNSGADVASVGVDLEETAGLGRTDNGVGDDTVGRGVWVGIYSLQAHDRVQDRNALWHNDVHLWGFHEDRASGVAEDVDQDAGCSGLAQSATVACDDTELQNTEWKKNMIILDIEIL